LHFRALKLNTAIKWIGFIVGFLGLVLSIFIVFGDKKKTAQVSAVAAVDVKPEAVIEGSASASERY